MKTESMILFIESLKTDKTKHCMILEEKKLHGWLNYKEKQGNKLTSNSDEWLPLGEDCAWGGHYSGAFWGFFLNLCNKYTSVLLFLCKLFNIFFPGHPMAYGVRKPGIRSSHSRDLHSSCGDTGSLTHYAGPGIEPASQGSRATVETPQLCFLIVFWTYNII